MRKIQRPTLNPEPLALLATPNQCCSMDFMSDSLFLRGGGRASNVVDKFNREALAIEVNLNLPCETVISIFLKRIYL